MTNKKTLDYIATISHFISHNKFTTGLLFAFMLGRALHYVLPHCVIKNYVFLADYDGEGTKNEFLFTIKFKPLLCRAYRQKKNPHRGSVISKLSAGGNEYLMLKNKGLFSLERQIIHENLKKSLTKIYKS